MPPGVPNFNQGSCGSDVCISAHQGNEATCGSMTSDAGVTGGGTGISSGDTGISGGGSAFGGTTPDAADDDEEGSGGNSGSGLHLLRVLVALGAFVGLGLIGLAIHESYKKEHLNPPGGAAATKAEESVVEMGSSKV